MTKAKKAEIEIRTGAGGESAYIAGSRVRVADIARLYPQLLDELIIERIVRSLPTLEPGQVRAAIDYWREHPAQIQTLIRKEEEILDELAEGGALEDLALSAFAEDWESKADSIYDDFLDDAAAPQG